MASTTRTTLRAAGLRPLNLPQPIAVEEDASGAPLRLNWRRGLVVSGPHAVAFIEERWRVVDEWWRADPVERDYFRLSLVGGRSVTVFRDAAGGWHRQSY